MKNIPIDSVRNFALMGHTGSGKTSLIDSILFKLGQVDRVGSPENGTSVADWTEEEKAHEISIWAKPFDGVYTAASGKTRRLGDFEQDVGGSNPSTPTTFRADAIESRGPGGLH